MTPAATWPSRPVFRWQHRISELEHHLHRAKNAKGSYTVRIESRWRLRVTAALLIECGSPYRCHLAQREEGIPIFGFFGLAQRLGSIEYSRPRRFRVKLEQWLGTIRTGCLGASENGARKSIARFTFSEITVSTRQKNMRWQSI